MGRYELIESGVGKFFEKKFGACKISKAFTVAVQIDCDASF